MSIFRYGKTPNPDQMKASGGFCPICQDAYQVLITLFCMKFSQIKEEDFLGVFAHFQRSFALLEKAITVLFDPMIYIIVRTVRKEGKGQNMFKSGLFIMIYWQTLPNMKNYSRNQPCFTASTYFVKSVLPPGLTGTQLVLCAGENLMLEVTFINFYQCMIYKHTFMRKPGLTEVLFQG